MEKYQQLWKKVMGPMAMRFSNLLYLSQKIGIKIVDEVLKILNDLYAKYLSFLCFIYSNKCAFNWFDVVWKNSMPHSLVKESRKRFFKVHWNAPVKYIMNVSVSWNFSKIFYLWSFFWVLHILIRYGIVVHATVLCYLFVVQYISQVIACQC